MGLSCIRTVLLAIQLPSIASGLRQQEKRSTRVTGYVAQSSGWDMSECQQSHVSDLYRPIKQVGHEHPGTDMNCWFHFYADYLGNPSGNQGYIDSFYGSIGQFSRDTHGPWRKLHVANGDVLTTQDDAQAGAWGNFAYDDGMCYLMGWMKGQRLDDDLYKMENEEDWLGVAQRECEQIAKMVNSSVTDENSPKMTIGYMQDDNDRIGDASSCGWEDTDPECRMGKRATVEDYVAHLYPKCLLGKDDGLTGAAGQIQWCFARSCVSEDKDPSFPFMEAGKRVKVVRHGKDCWPEGLPSLFERKMAARP